ncbi:MAG TPA: sugar phosphate isomerase/epimerase family protein [Roseiflexaceae bacterium]|nr:sugar phosphate isomerase/epimerase family protein [Roseiflexaceae bacterium]
MNTISFITANYVARETGFNVTEGWMQGDRDVNAAFRPIETFADRFDALLGHIRTLGFTAIDLWLAHLHWSWASDEHVRLARDLLAKHGLAVTSLAGGFGATREELTAACRLAIALGTNVLGGSAPLLRTDRDAAVGILREHGVRLAIENHPAERTPADILAQIGDGAGGTIGTALDTGWWGTQGYDAVRAIEELRNHIVTVHLKDVLAAGAHDTCLYGRGVVPVERCVRALQGIGYTGPIGIEHEPFGYDPSEECAQMLRMVRGWLAS